MAVFNRVTIVGLGLIGGSLGMAIRRKRLARAIVGLSRSAATVRRAARRGAITAGTTHAAEAVREADLVILATPVDLIAPTGKRLARFMRPGAILTDVGSTKTQLVGALERSLPAGIAFVGAHPLAGSELRGIEAADVGLFDGAVCVLTPTARTDRRAQSQLARLWGSLGCRVVTMSPQAHDRVLAGVSHLPHLIAFSLAGAASPAPLPAAPPSFLEMTRIAKSDPDLWDDILLGNRAELLLAAGRFERRWRTLRALLARGDRAGLRRFLADAKATRDALD